MRRLAQFVIEVPLQYVVQVPKRLLLRQDGDVILLGVIHDFFDFSRVQRAFFRPDQRVVAILKDVLDVERMQVQLVLSLNPNLLLDVIK